MTAEPTGGPTRAIILAAGDSRRMGTPKALLDLAGETFLERIVGVFQAARVADISVVVGGAHEGPVRAAIAALPGVEAIANPDPSPGPVSSVRIGMAGAPPAAAYLVHPVDIPGIRLRDVRELLAGAGEEDDVVFLVHKGRRAHPVWIAGRHRQAVVDLSDGESLRGFFRSPGLQLRHLESSNPWLRRDVDTPAELAALRAAFHAGG